MNTEIRAFRYLFITGMLVFINPSCQRKPELPAVITSDASNVTSTSALSGGTVIDDGGAYVTDSGICWSTSGNPAISDNQASCCPGNGPFIIRLTGLLPDTRYYTRAYATNSAGTAYGNNASFITGEIGPASVLTTRPNEISLTTASSGGYILSDGGSEVSEKGVCWSTSPDPTIHDNKTTDEYTGNEKSFSSRLTGLTPGTSYYARAYATNNAGTSYGNQSGFTTMSDNPVIFNPALIYGTVADIEGNIYRTVQIGTQTWMAENLKTTRFNDDTPIPYVTGNDQWLKMRGAAMCWYVNDPGVTRDMLGGYYNIYTVLTGKLCPIGWHVPDKTDWTTLISFLGGSVIAGGNAKETGTAHWFSPNLSATNESGFTGLPGGYRPERFENAGERGYWWSRASSYYYHAYNYDSYVLDYRNSNFYLNLITYYTDGLNVRCVQD